MGWAIGYDGRWKRDVGYGVPSICDAPKCDKEIDRGLAYVCGGEPYGGDLGCGLYFCSDHLFYHRFRGEERGAEYCKRCSTNRPSYREKPDMRKWKVFKLLHSSWEDWRKNHTDDVVRMTAEVGPITPEDLQFVKDEEYE